MRRLILFDVNETLLDLSALDPHFERMFADASVRTLWFGQVLQSALVATLTGEYTDFGTVGRAALAMVAARRGVEISESDRTALRDGMLNLPAHREVPEALERLRKAGFRMAALTNSAQQDAEAQITNARLGDFFDEVLSVDGVRRFKPAHDVYLMAARLLAVEPPAIRFVAAHDWDVHGAMKVGCAAAFVARPGMVLGPLTMYPDIVGADLSEVADRIIERDG